MTAFSSHPLRPLLVATASAVLAALLPVAPADATGHDRTADAVRSVATTRTVVDGGTIDTSNRQQVFDSFAARWIPAMATPLTWTGDVATCQPGVPSASVLDASLSVTNYLRDMAGVPPVAADPVKHARAQQAALMMDANNTLDHYPKPSMRCYTPDGALAASKSNLALGYSSVKAVGGYMSDTGSNNSYAGHRKWILDPGVSTVGFGITPRGNAMYVVGEDYQWDAGTTAVAWPTAGFFPEGLYPGADEWAMGWRRGTEPERWSYTTYNDTEFAAASVTVTQTAPTVKPLPVTIENRSTGHLVFAPVGVTLPSEASGQDVTYQVTITGIRDADGAPVADVTYATTLIASPSDPDEPDDPDNPDDPNTPRTTGKVIITGTAAGTARPGMRLRATLTGFRLAPTRVTYQWLRNGRPIKQATRATYRLTRADARSKVRVKIAVRKPRAVAGTYRSPVITVRRR